MKNFIISIFSIVILFSMVSCASTENYDNHEYIENWVEKHSSKEVSELYFDDIVYVIESLPADYRTLLLKQNVRFSIIKDKHLLSGGTMGLCQTFKESYGLSFKILIANDEKRLFDEWPRATIYHEICHLFNDISVYKSKRRGLYSGNPHESYWKKLMIDLTSGPISENAELMNTIYEDLSMYPDSD